MRTFTIASILLLACSGGGDDGTECLLNDTRDCPGGYQVCDDDGWSECKPLYRDVDTGRIVATDCVFEPGIYTVEGKASSIETLTYCQSEFIGAQVFEAPPGVEWIRFGEEGAEPGDCEELTVSDGGCSRLCGVPIEGGTYQELLRVTSETTLEGHATVRYDDGRRCQYDLTLTKE